VDGEPEPYPYTKIRDWVALLSQGDLSDGAFRLYYISRSVIWENAKGGPPPKPVVEITYEEYAQIMGRSSRTISRFAEDLLKVGLWEELERASRSVRLPGRPRPQVQTVLTIRVHDYPREPWSFTGPTKTWDVLGSIRDAKRRTHGSPTTDTAAPGSAGQCEATDVSTQCDQGGAGQPPPGSKLVPPDTTSVRDVPAGQCGLTDLSAQSEHCESVVDHGGCPREDHPDAVSPAETSHAPRRTGTTDVSTAATDLSEISDVSAGQNARGAPLKKKGEEDKPSLPPVPSQPQRESLADELAMFTDATVELVGELYGKTVTTPGLPPLSAAERAGLARRIDARLAEGWSLSRVRAVLTGGSLVGVKMPGRLWAGRLDDMPSYRSLPGCGDQHTQESATDDRRSARRHERAAVVTNDCSTMPDPNAGKARYEVPEGRGTRMVVRWGDSRRVAPWCGRCSSDSRCLRPSRPGSLLRACPDCHPEPQAFPPEPEPEPEPVASDAAEDDTTPPDSGHKRRQTPNGQTAGARLNQRSRGAQSPLSVPAKEGN
jgi:hypothetical protein